MLGVIRPLGWVDAMNLDKKALAGFIKEIEDSRTRQKAETEFQRDVFKRARDKNFDVKAMRIVLQRRAMEPGKRDEQDYNVHAYEMALGAKKEAVEDMERGMSAREAAAKHGLPRAAVTALKPGAENANFEPENNTESSGGMGDAQVAHAEGVSISSTPKPTPEAPLDLETAVSDQPGDDTRTPEPSRSASVVANPSSGPRVQTCDGAAPAADCPLDTHSDDLAIPQFLQRTRAA